MSHSFANGKFIDTPTSRTLLGFVDKVETSRRCGWIKGESGVGKTAVIHHVKAQENRYAKLITVLKTNGSTRAFLETFAQVIGCNSISNSAKALYDKIEDFMALDHFGEYHRDFQCQLLFVDEAQHLDLETMRVVLELQKNSGLPIVFLSNEERLQRSRLHDPALKQIANRIPFRINIDGIRSGDIQSFAIAHNVEGIDEYHYLEEAAKEGNLHDLTFILQEARILAGPRGSIRLQHLRDAVTLWRGEDRDRHIFKLIPKAKRGENAA